MEFKVTINTKNDHVLHHDKIVNVSTGKEFNDIHEAIKDINGGVCMLLHYLDVAFHIEGKGTIGLEKLDCYRDSIKSIHQYLSYLSRIDCDIATYITIKEFIDEVYCDNNEDMIDILMSLARIHSSR